MALIASSPDELAFEALLAQRGELVTFRSVPTLALVNRSPKRPSWNGPEKTGAPLAAIIQFRASLAEPKIGNSCVDQFGITHRFTAVKHIKHAWESECSSHPARP